MRLAELELDLDVFAGPFDLLLSLILREELDLLEVDLAEIVVTYLDHLEATAQLDLESATEFLVLIAALLELKSRLMLPGEEVEELDELAPAEAAEELIERMLQYARFRAAGAHLAKLQEHERGFLYRSAPHKLGPGEVTAGAYEPSVLGAAIGSLLRMPKPIDLSHMAMPRVTVGERLQHLRGLLKRASSFSFEEAVKDADRVTICVTVFALLELYKRGEASWEQDEPFGEITVHVGSPVPAAAEAEAA
ncbi:condensin subunit ScpA [Solirubrobacter pauli]|uniref:Segregation and condensation protein A n=1 Tax=Solirubrobacter pauli TaxID=166793 RepID=A0A660L3J4_9ACTN|nr:ScpA family protein [Solirubrobacter pauli]RKQ88008.1 condensin subunit ScpA [Solirubrobacter pauli]